MAHPIFNHILNAIEERLVSIENNICGYPEYFKSWHTGDGEGQGRVFQRHTKLTLRVMFWLITSRIVRSLPVALDAFFSMLGLPSPTKSAFSMKRTVITSGLFRSMSESVVKTFYGSGVAKTWRGHILLACDGSRVSLPDVKELGDHFGRYRSNRGEILYPSAKACVFQDTLNNITVLASLETKDKDERYSFDDYFRQAGKVTGLPSIMLLDKGYFSYLLMYHMIKSGQKFVMKAKSTMWRTKFINSGLRQATIAIKPSKRTSIFKDADWRKEPVGELVVRLVRFDHPDGIVDVLVTNLTSAENVTYKNVIELYRLRWPVETAYGIYKNDEALELFSSFRIEGVLQDFYAAIIMFNLASILAMDANHHNGSHRANTQIGRKPDMNVVI